MHFFVTEVEKNTLPGSSVHGILQARILEWIAILFSRGSSRPRDQILLSCIAGRFFTFEPQGSPVLLSYRKYKMVGRVRGSIRLTVSFFSWDCITGDVVYPPLGISSGAMLPPIIFSGMRGQCQWGQGCYQSYLFE